MSELERFIEAKTDVDRLALGRDVLAAALEQAREQGQQGRADEIYEYWWAVHTGLGLNRPLKEHEQAAAPPPTAAERAPGDPGGSGRNE